MTSKPENHNKIQRSDKPVKETWKDTKKTQVTYSSQIKLSQQSEKTQD